VPALGNEVGGLFAGLRGLLSRDSVARNHHLLENFSCWPAVFQLWRCWARTARWRTDSPNWLSMVRGGSPARLRRTFPCASHAMVRSIFLSALRHQGNQSRPRIGSRGLTSQGFRPQLLNTDPGLPSAASYRHSASCPNSF
jgi:hypothetical protein